MRPSTSSACGERQIREIIRFAEWFLHNGKMQLFDSYLWKSTSHFWINSEQAAPTGLQPAASRFVTTHPTMHQWQSEAKPKTIRYTGWVCSTLQKSKVVKLLCWTFSGNMMKLGPSKCIPLRLKVWLGMTASSPPTCVQQKMFSRDPLSDSVDRMTVLNLYMFGSFQQCQILKDVASKLSISISKRKLRERDGSGRWNWLWLYLYLAGKKNMAN